MRNKNQSNNMNIILFEGPIMGLFKFYDRKIASYLSFPHNKVQRNIFFYIFIFASSKKHPLLPYWILPIIFLIITCTLNISPFATKILSNNTNSYIFTINLYFINCVLHFFLSNKIYIGLWYIGFILYMELLWLM